MKNRRRVRVLVNPRAGKGTPATSIVRAVEEHWAAAGMDVSYQFSQSVEDGREKVRLAVRDGVDTILVAGGDGMVNTVGGALVNTDVALGVIPAGSGNGFARHFGIPLHLNPAVQTLLAAQRKQIDVGTANGRPFFVTCSMAGDAELVKHFEKFPVRGVLPYVLAAAYEAFEYVPQPFQVTLDGRDNIRFKDVIVFTVANLTQFGGGALIAPRACPDDGKLEMVVVAGRDMGTLLSGIPRLFNGTIDQLPGVTTQRFQKMTVYRQRAAAIQVDGELMEPAAQVEVRVLKQALTVLVPTAKDKLVSVL